MLPILICKSAGMPYPIGVYYAFLQVTLELSDLVRKQSITSRVSIHRNQEQCKHILTHSLIATTAWPQKASLKLLNCRFKQSGLGCFGAQNYPIADCTSWSSDIAYHISRHSPRYR